MIVSHTYQLHLTNITQIADGPVSQTNNNLWVVVIKLDHCWPLFFKKWANPGFFFVYFWSFHTTNTIFSTNQCEKCPSSIQHWDSNPWPFKHESSPITTRPGLPPCEPLFYFLVFSQSSPNQKQCDLIWRNFTKIEQSINPSGHTDCKPT